jgi:hypothetical protein
MWVWFFLVLFICVSVLFVGLYVWELKKDGVQGEYDPIDLVSVSVYDSSQSVDDSLKLGAVSADLTGIPYYEWRSKVRYSVPDLFYYKPMYLVPTVSQGGTSMCVPYAVLQMIVARRFVSKQVFPSCGDPLVMLSTRQYLEVSGEKEDYKLRSIPSVLDYMRSDKYGGVFRLESDESKTLSIKLGSTYQYGSIGDIQRDIFENGPVVTVMQLPKQVQTMEYKVTNGEFPPELFVPSVESETVGGHAVLVIGWLYERSRLPVSRLLWICKNSWGTNWPKNPWRGMSGVFFVDATMFDVTKNCLSCSVE